MRPFPRDKVFSSSCLSFSLSLTSPQYWLLENYQWDHHDRSQNELISAGGDEDLLGDGNIGTYGVLMAEYCFIPHCFYASFFLLFFFSVIVTFT